MELISVTTGSWFPRTKLHLKEYFRFLKGGGSHLPLDATQLKKLHDRLSPARVAYFGGRFDKVTAELNGFGSTYFEDGLLLLEAEVGDGDVDRTMKKLREFYHGRLAPALSLIYSVGAPMLVHEDGHGPETKLVLIASKGATREEVDALAARHKEAVHFVATHGGRTVYFAENLIVVNDDSDDPSLLPRVVRMILFFREYEHRLRHFLEIQRSIWESIAALRTQETYTIKELPRVRDRLQDYDRDLAVVRGRLSQMDSYLDERKDEIDALGVAETLRALEAYRFGKMRSTTTYLKQLLEVLDQYIKSTIDITGLMHQENLQREINLQQFIFLLGSVAALFSLGALLTSRIVLHDPDGRLVADGTIFAFSLVDLFKLGGPAIVFTLVVFLGIRPFVANLRRIRTETLLGVTDRPRRGAGTVPPPDEV